MTNKTRNIILHSSFIAMSALIIGMLFYYVRYHEDDMRWAIGVMLLEIVLFGLWFYVVPRFLEMRVDNQHKVSTYKDRRVFNGREHIARYIYGLAGTFVFMFSFEVWQIFHDHPTSSLGRAIGFGLLSATFFVLCLSPIWGDMIYRCVKNTYTIEGGNLLIDEWAWFRKKTDHLLVPISEIESIRKKNNGLAQTCNIEIQVNGIKRILATGMVGDSLYDALKERMA